MTAATTTTTTTTTTTLPIPQRYRRGLKYCSRCEKWLAPDQLNKDNNPLRCASCSTQLRSRPRKSSAKKAYVEYMQNAENLCDLGVR
jgi:hypothetical protein